MAETKEQIDQRIAGLLGGQTLAEQEAIVRHWIAQLDLQIELEEVRPTLGYEARIEAVRQVRRRFLAALDRIDDVKLEIEDLNAQIEAKNAEIRAIKRSAPQASQDQYARMRKHAEELLRSDRRGSSKSILGIFTRRH